jgi:hypothetical protein
MPGSGCCLAFKNQSNHMSQEQQPRVHKDTIEIYRVRGLKHGYWADISIDEGNNAGRISISSSNGNWSYYWGACGEPFKRFLIRLDIHYTAGKFRCGNALDLPSTIESWKRQLLERRRQYDIEAEEAREIYDQIDTIAGSCNTRGDLEFELAQCDELIRFLAYDPDIQTKIDTQFKVFWTKIWPHFIEAIKEETASQAA